MKIRYLSLVVLLFFSASVYAQSGSGRVIINRASDGVTEDVDSQILRGSMADFASVINMVVKLPGDVYLTVRQCGFASANYNRSTRTVTVCREMIEKSRLTVTSAYAGTLLPDEIEGAVRGLIWHIFLHEMGHAFLDGIAAMGKPEDNADFMAVLLTLPIQAAITDAVLGASAFHRSRLNWQHYGSQHALSDVRRANLACWYFGKMPNSLTAAMFASVDLPLSRKQQCRKEYEAQASAVFSIFGGLRAHQEATKLVDEMLSPLPPPNS
jgi:hypothetical protein